jgi:ankyrin repeat protein
MHECCVNGNSNMLKDILQYIDDINKPDMNKQTAAHLASKYGELECLKILFANGTDHLKKIISCYKKKLAKKVDFILF